MGIRRNSRLRAKQLGVYEDVLAGYTYRQAARKWGYSDESGARAAFKAERARHEQSAADKRAEITARLGAVIDAYSADALAGDSESARTLLAAMRDTARLLGLNAPVNVAVGGGISAAEFGEQFTALFEAAPDTMRWLAPRLPEELLGQVPEETRAQLFHAEEPVQHRSPSEDGWCNVVPGDVGGPHHTPQAWGYQPYGATPESPSESRTEPFSPDPEPHDDRDDGEEVVEVVAELIPLPPAQRRVPSGVDGNGVPYDRGGIHRRLPGPSSRHYNPLGYSGWTQIIRPTDD